LVIRSYLLGWRRLVHEQGTGSGCDNQDRRDRSKCPGSQQRKTGADPLSDRIQPAADPHPQGARELIDSPQDNIGKGGS
jgi:hypothetical protein